MDAEVYYSPGVLLVNTSSITAVFDGTISISISASSGMLSAVCSLLEQYHNGTRGLLGEDPASIPSLLLQHCCRARDKVPVPAHSCWKTHRDSNLTVNFHQVYGTTTQQMTSRCQMEPTSL